MRCKRILIGEEELYRMRANAKLNGVSEQIGQPQPDCECQDDRNSNERKHPVRVRHSVFSQCYRANHFGFGGGMKIPNASGALPTVIVEGSTVFVAVSMIDTVPSAVPLPSFAT